MAQPRASGVRVYSATPSFYQQWPVYICLCVDVRMHTCNNPNSLSVSPAPLTPLLTSTPQFASTFTLLLPVEHTQKSLQFSSFCLPCYVSCLHEIGCSVCFCFSFCFLPMSHWQQWRESQLATILFIFKCFFFVFNVQLRYLYFCNIKYVVIFFHYCVVMPVDNKCRDFYVY